MLSFIGLTDEINEMIKKGFLRTTTTTTAVLPGYAPQEDWCTTVFSSCGSLPTSDIHFGTSVL